ncbi:septum formation initiator family protein [Ruminococcus sp. 5_1_39BFAA]|uniref:FtsB family cell division protein n=1 Tax=Ruminococcus sp. 5_1_39BFAA TaxID=457412 RepID=UPI003565DD54
MGKSEKKGRKKRIGYNHLGMLGIALVVLILLVGLMLKSQDLKGTLAVYNARAASLEQDIESEKARTEEIEQLREYMLTDEYAEQVARERLGLIKENEIVFQEEN